MVQIKIKCPCGGWGLKESAEEGKTLIAFGVLGKWVCYVPFSFLSLFCKLEFFPNKRFENNYLSSLNLYLKMRFF